MKKLFTVLFIMVVVLGLTGCSKKTDVHISTDVDYMNKQNEATGEIISSVQHEIDVDGTKLIVDYDTAGYDLNNWYVTDNKRIKVNVYEEDGQKDNGNVIFLEHMHADLTLQSIGKDTNGITHDSMDDSYHGTSQDGFVIGPKGKSYEEIFSIEGYNAEFLSFYGSSCYNFGVIHGGSHRVTEDRIYDGGVYGEKLTVVLDFIVKNPGDEFFHTVSVIDEVSVLTARSMYKDNVQISENDMRYTVEGWQQ